MKPEKVFKRYDIRGKYPEEIDEEFGKRLGKSIGSFCSRNFSDRIVVCRDNKDSSRQLKKALIQGLRSTGVDVLDTGEGPTDYAAFSGKRKNAVSVQVTSSHMPLDFNGFKMMYPEGNGLINRDMDTIKEIFREKDFEEGLGGIENVEKTMKDAYRDEILEKASMIGKESLDKKIVIDSLGGATRDLLPELLREMGAEVIEIEGDEAKMPYRDPPNPKPENLEDLSRKARDTDADLGVATDMDGDRLKVFKNGFLSGDEVFGILGQKVDGDIVASVDSSKMLERSLQEERDVHYTRVGDPFVLEEALERDVALAGEPNGHYSFLDFLPYNSGILAGLVVAGTDIEEELEGLPEYHTERFSLEVENKEKSMDEIREEVKETYNILSEVDGVKFEMGGCTVLVRPSGSSKKLRIIMEAEGPQLLEGKEEKIRDLIQ